MFDHLKFQAKKLIYCQECPELPAVQSYPHLYLTCLFPHSLTYNLFNDTDNSPGIALVKRASLILFVIITLIILHLICLCKCNVFEGLTKTFSDLSANLKIRAVHTYASKP